MQKCLFLFIIFLLNSGFELQARKEYHQDIDQRENYFQTSTPNKITPNVNPITGDLIEEEMDLVVAGCEPLSVRRFYNHTAPLESRTGGWRFNPETFFVANFEWKKQEIFASLGDFDGSITPFQPSGNTCKFDVKNGFSSFNPSGQTHPLNTRIAYQKSFDHKNKKRFFWHGKVIQGNGAIRHFSSNMHCWLDKFKYHTGTRSFFEPGTQYTWSISQNVWTPYQLKITEEKKENGNLLCYTYTQWKDEERYPKPGLLASITAYNADKTKTLGSITFHYHQDEHGNVHGVTAVGSDGRQVAVGHHGSSPILLHTVHTPDKPMVSYSYQDSWVNRVEKPEGRVITTEYDGAGKVVAQYAPVGPNGEMHPISRYIYHDRDTEVFDGEGNKTIYRFNEHKQVLSLEIYQGDQLYRVDRLTWDTSTGNLLKKSSEDSHGQLLQTTEYAYDKNHNPIVERIGDGREWRTINRTFSDDGFNLKLSESDREGKLTCYKYIPNTNLLSSELVYEKDAICQRTFHFYDDCAIRIKTVIDDGDSEDANNLKKVTYRKITQIMPKQTQPCFGLPEVVEEKTIDSLGNEALLHKVVYTYAPFGKVLKEEHYDSEGLFRYSIANGYDEKERLAFQTNQLGHTTRFSYDANNNLTSISGPKPGQHQEITYDQANRPIRIADWRTDGTILIHEKKYDKQGRVIEITDPCQNTTRFEYDALDRLITTIHPDNAVEIKEYDHFDNVIKEIDPEGYETHKTYNCFGEVTEISYPDGSRESFSYNPTGTPASKTDKNGAHTDYRYDCFDHLINTATYSSSNQLLKQTSALWTPFQKISETDGALTTTYSYDFAGRKIDEHKDARHIHYSYDSLGRIHITEEGNTEIIEEYDLADQVIETRKEKSAILQSKESYVYDASGNCTQIINSQGAQETLFDTDDNPLSITDPLGFSTRFIYSYSDAFTQTHINPKGVHALSIHDSRGREVSYSKKNHQDAVIQQYENVYDKNGNRIALFHTIFSGTIPIKTIAHRWEYGPLGRIERYIEAGERETRYLYDGKGRLKTIIKPNGCLLQHEYDDLGRLLRFYAEDFDYHYAYDQNDHVTSVHDKISDTVTTRCYDPLGNLLEERLANDLVLTNSYDNLGRRVGLSLPDASCIEYTYDGHYLYQIKRGSYTHTYSRRNLEGQVVKAELPDSQEVLIERDKCGRYMSYHSPYYLATYPQNAYDGNGNLLCYQFQDLYGKAKCIFAYDDLDQVIADNDHVYQFDSLYNRLKKDHSDYTVDTFCQVSSDGRTTYAYDICGNLISDGAYTYSYDSLDRLIAIDSDSIHVEYTYDAFNRRLSKTLFGWFSNTYIRYMWDGDHEIGAVDGKDYIQELRVLGEGFGAEIGAAVLYELNGKSYIPIHDHRGCIVTLVDLYTKKPIENYRYTAFGEELTQNKLSPWRFASKRVDDETGLVFFGRRYYHPELGRWITQDPEGFEDGPNLYAYLKNCPLTDFDPYGLWSWNGMWGGTKDFFGGAYDSIKGGAHNMGYGFAKMGEWMYADFQYEYFNDRSFFEQKSYQAVEDWKSLGRAARDDPLGMVIPGVMEAWRNPTDPAAWGKATVDIGLIGFSASKIGNASRLSRVGKSGGGLSAFGKVENITMHIPKNLSKGGAESTANAFRLRNQLIGQEIAGGHAFTKHVLQQGEFKGLGIQARTQFARHIEIVTNNPTATRQLSSGRTAYWHEPTGTVVIRNPRVGDGGTAFQPVNGQAYFDNLR